MVGRFLVFLGGLLVVALFAALLAPVFIDWTDFRREFEDQASRILGKKVAVLGDVDARFLPFPSVTLHDVTVGRDSDGSPLVHVERFAMDAELAPLLSGEVRVFDMRIENPRVRARVLPDGRLDWTRGSRPEIPARTIVMENIHVSGGVIEFIDEQANRTRRVTGLNAEMSAKSLAGPWTVDGKAVVDGEAGAFHLSSQQPVEGTGAIPLRLRLQPDERPFSVELDGELAIAEGRPSYKGNFQGEWKLEVPAGAEAASRPVPTVKGAFELANDRIRVPSYRLELGTPDNPYAVNGEATLDTGRAPEFLLTAEGQQIDVSRIDAVGTKGKTGRDPQGSVRQRLNRLMEMASGIPVPEVPGRASLSLPAIVAGDTVIRDIKLDVRPDGVGWNVENAVATLPGRTQVEAKGRLLLRGEPAFAGDLLVATTQPSGLASWLTGNVDPAIRQLNSAGFSALVSLTPDLQRFEKLELSIGQDRLLGRVERQSFANAMPNLSFDLNGNSLDLNAMRALATLFAGQDAGDSLFDHRIGARLKVGTFTAFDAEARDLDTVFSIGEEGLSVSKLNIGDLAGASIRASGRAVGALLDYSGEGDISLTAADPGRFLEMLGQHLGEHPALSRLIANAGWYANSNLTARVAMGEQAGGALTVALTGTSNGSRISANYSREDAVDLMAMSPSKLTARIDNPDPATLLGQIGFSPLPLDGDGSAQVTVTLSQDGADAPVEGQMVFSTGMTTVEASGSIGIGAADFLDGSARISVDSADLEPYLVMNGIVLPAHGSGLSVKGAADVAIGRDTVDVTNLSVVAGGNRIDGTMQLDRKAALMKGRGEMTLATLDLPWLAETVLGALEDPTEGGLNQLPLPVIAPSGLDYAIDLKAAQFWPGRFGPVSDFTAKLAARDAAIALENVSGAWLGGRLGGQLSLTNAEGSGFLQARVNVENADVAALAPVRDTTPAAGRFNLAWATEGSGKTAAELIGGVNGSGTLTFKDLKATRLDLGMLAPLLSAADLLEGEITQEKVEPLVASLVEGNGAILGAVSVPFNVTSGVARAQNIVAANDAARMSSDVRLTLATGELDAAVTVAMNPGDEALAGADPTFRLLYRGDVAEPERSLDVVELTNFLSLRAFERERRRVETLQANVLEKQRLRREVALYRFEARERERLAAEEKARLEQEARIKAEQVVVEAERAKAAEAERLKQEEEARVAAEAAKAAQEAEARRAAEESARQAAEAEAARRAAEEAARRAQDRQVQPAPNSPPAGGAQGQQGAADPPVAPEAQTTQSVPARPAMPVRPEERVTRGESLPPVKFEGLPGVN